MSRVPLPFTNDVAAPPSVSDPVVRLVVAAVALGPFKTALPSPVSVGRVPQSVYMTRPKFVWLLVMPWQLNMHRVK